MPLLYDIVQVEVIKGSSGALFGGGEPGGLINYVTKRPSDVQEGLVSAVTGSYGLHGVNGEYSGPIDDAGTFVFRIAGAFEDTDTFRKNTAKEDLVFGLALEWRPSNCNRGLLHYDYIEEDFQGARLRGVPVDDDGDFLTSRRFSTNEKSDFQQLEASVVTVSFDHALSDNPALTLAARDIESDEAQNDHENRGLFTDAADVTFALREFRDQTRDIQQLSALAELTYRFDSSGGVLQQLLLGTEHYQRDNEDLFLTSSDSRRAGLLPNNFIVLDLNFFSPDYGNSNPSLFDPLLEVDREVEFDSWALYIQDQIQLTDNLRLSIGGRFESFSEDIVSVETVIPFAMVTDTVADQDDEAFTFRFGAVYDWSETVAVYANCLTGLNPQGSGSQDPSIGGPFDPETSELVEFGAKIDLYEDAVFLQFSIYQIEKEDISVVDPTPGAGALALIGEARSRGPELDLVGDLGDNWTFTFSYGYNDTVIVEGDDAIRNTVGDEFVNAPDHQIGVWARYDIPAINSAVAVGGQWVSDQISFSGQDVQSFEVVDISWITRWDKLELQINARNLFDKEYAESGFLARTGDFPGDARTLRAQLTWSL